MNLLDSTHVLPDGSEVLVEGAAQDIVRRVRNGDPTLGWEGDPDMRVVLSPYANMATGEMSYRFEVWGLDYQRKPYLAVHSATCGPELIRRLVHADTRRRDVVGDLIKAQEKLYADQKKALSEATEEAADKLAFALVKENGHHFGNGLTKRFL